VNLHKEIRAMDRRRFVPSSEGLEGRALQTAFNVNNIFGFQASANLNVPITFQQKSLRIQHLPFYLEKISPGRFLPKAEIEQIQGALFNMVDGIHKPPSKVLDNFNYQLRKVVPKQSLTAGNLHLLNRGVAAVLRSAAAPQSSIDGISSALFTLTSQIDTASVMPVYLATNDSTLVLQTALAIGRPMPPPTLPRIKRNNGIQAGAQHMKTPLERPRLVGTYHYHTLMEVVTTDGQVIGAANVRRNNNYVVQITTPLSLGVHELHLQALDTVGHVSRPSRPFFIKVVPKKHQDPVIGKSTPKGPLR
jgi:hypothetical protein